VFCLSGNARNGGSRRLGAWQFRQCEGNEADGLQVRLGAEADYAAMLAVGQLWAMNARATHDIAMADKRNLFSGPVHEGLHFFESECAILVAVHCLENSFVGCLKLCQ
jgi:hypothetical protein